MNNLLPALDQSFSCCFTTDFVDTTSLSQSERSLIQNAVKKRQNEFSTGRYCARQALTKLGIKYAEILKGNRGEPLWPVNITGSISHNSALCGAIVANKSKVSAIGLDIETIGSVKPDLWYLLFNAAETKLLNELPLSERDLFATLFFSFKESFYKLQYPLTGLYLDFLEVEVSYQSGCFNLTVISPHKLVALSKLQLHLLYNTFKDNVITVCYL